MPAFEKKGVYHKTLLETGPFHCKVGGAAFKSQWKDNYGHDQYTVKFTAEGKEHYYNTTRKDVADYFGSFTGKSVLVTAQKDGTLLIGNVQGDAKAAGTVTAADLPQPKEAVHAASRVSFECLIGKKMAFARAKELHDAIKEKFGIEFPLEQLCADANSIFIHMGQRGSYGSGGVIAGLSE